MTKQKRIEYLERELKKEKDYSHKIEKKVIDIIKVIKNHSDEKEEMLLEMVNEIKRGKLK